jgi:hypothetical protein
MGVQLLMRKRLGKRLIEEDIVCGLKFVKSRFIIAFKSQIFISIFHLFCQAIAVPSFGRKLKTSNEVVQHGLIILLHDVLYHFTLPKVLLKRRQLLLSNELVSKLGVCLLRRMPFVKYFNRLFIFLNEAAQSGVISGLRVLALAFIP